MRRWKFWIMELYGIAQSRLMARMTKGAHRMDVLPLSYIYSPMIVIWQLRMVVSAAWWVAGVTPAQQFASTVSSISG